MNTTELEQGLIGAILSNYKKCLPLAQKVLNVDDFFNPKYAFIYKTFLDMDRRGMAIDIITLYGEIANNTFGITASEISGLTDLGFPSSIETYAQQLKQASKTRKFTETIQTAAGRLVSGEPYADVVDSVTGVISELEKDTVSDFVRAKDRMNEIYDIVKNGKEQGISTGYEKLDKILKGLHKQNFIVIAADTGKGKTAFVLNIIANVLSSYRHVLLYSLEMSVDENFKRLLSIISNTNSNIPDSSLMPEEIENRLNACGLISGYNVEINDKSQSIRTLSASAKAKANDMQRLGEKIDLIVVDYMQIMQNSSKSDNREGEVAEIARRLKDLAKELDVPIIGLAQVNRGASKEKRNHEINDLRESAAIGHAADVVMFLNQDSDEPDSYVLGVKKNRHGPEFFMKMLFNRQSTKFTEVIE
jgi:replicative DNA helicase